MSLLYDISKMLYSRQGYLSDIPYHLISNEEMFDAFIWTRDEFNSIQLLDISDYVNLRPTYFGDHYYPPSDEYKDRYLELVDTIIQNIDIAKQSDELDYQVPDWVGSYMIGEVIGPESDKLDIHDLLVLMNADNLDDTFNSYAAGRCYEISTDWLRKLASSKLGIRVPSIFGELHVIKSLRLQDVSVLV